MIPQFMDLLDKMKDIHSKKNRDYAAPDSPFENFERSALLASWFNYPIDKSFVVLIGTKLARLSTLLNSGAAPNNESVEDSFLDLCTYCALWASQRKSQSELGIKRDTTQNFAGTAQQELKTFKLDVKNVENSTGLEPFFIKERCEVVSSTGMQCQLPKGHLRPHET